MTQRLTGKVALITGGSRGIGAEIARRFAEQGANIVISYASSPQAAEEVVSSARKSGVEAEAIQADSADSAAIESLVQQTVKRFGGLDILVNNAGIFAGGSLEESSDEDFQSTIDINVRAVFVAAREAAKSMTEGGRIINIGSIFGERVPMPGIGLYSMSKFAVAGFTRAWARDLGAKGITVNCIQPGPINTDMNPEDGDLSEVLTPGTALGRYGRPREIADTAVFLASSESSYVTGTVIDVDGGFEA
jgi:3-oxoacyl-[acyl-carrier protein] reductase